MASLKAMKYRELQKVAKEVGVKANLSTVVLIQKILDAKLADTAAHQRPHVRHGGIQAEHEQPAEVGQHQVQKEILNFTIHNQMNTSRSRLGTRPSW